MKKEAFFLLVVFFLAAFLRFYKLSNVPLGLYVDEASIGYNSYSILKTGKDEYGKSFPVYFRSFGDYKMPLYIYLSTIPIKIFDLNIFSIRFLSALSGSLTIFIVYFLVKNLFPGERKLALTAATLFAIFPWTVFLSRMALEMQLGLFLLLLAILFHQKALQFLKLKWWVLTVIFYGLSAYAYHTEKFISPLIFVLWSFLNYPRAQKKITTFWRINFTVAVGLMFVLLWPQLKLSFSSGANARIRNLTFFQDRQNIPYGNTLPAKVRKWSAMYTAYFSPRNLFFDSDPDPQRSLPQLSVFYSWMIIPFFIGIYYFFREKEDFLSKKLIYLLLAISPLPASFTGDPFSTFRAYPLVFPFGVLIALGVIKILERIGCRASFLNGLIFLSLSLAALWRSVFILLPNERFLNWKYGYEQLVGKIIKGNYREVLIDDPLGISYSEILFFNKFNPIQLQKERKVDLSKYYSLNNWEVEQTWDKYEVRSIFWKKDIYKDQLIIATPLAISESQAKEHFFTKVFAIIGPDREAIFNGYLTNPTLKIQDNERRLKTKNESRNF